MPKTDSSPIPDLPTLSPALQLAFYARLQSVRGLYLYDALSETVKSLEIPELDKELAQFVGAEYLKKVAIFGLRAEVLFPAPKLLIQKPTLLGYYRLLYGFSQKEFYKGPFSTFRRLEDIDGPLPPSHHKNIPNLCNSLIGTGKMLLDGLNKLSLPLANDLQLLTLGPQFRGSRNTSLGQQATKEVFDLIKGILGKYAAISDETSMTVENDSKNKVTIAFSADPDIEIIQQLPTAGVRPVVSIEIKGGTDYSNIHNRIGEAEKSHQKAKQRGFFEFWTIIAVDLDYKPAKIGSPTTSHFFQLSKITNKKDPEYNQFQELLCSLVGVKTTER